MRLVSFIAVAACMMTLTIPLRNAFQYSMPPASVSTLVLLP